MSSVSDVLSREEHARILREQIIPDHNLGLATSQEKPSAVILGGQPGVRQRWTLKVGWCGVSRRRNRSRPG